MRIICGSYYIPNNFFPAKTILKEYTNFDDDKICTFLNSSHLDRIAIEKENDEIDICINLMNKLIDDNNLLPNEINYILYINSLNTKCDDISVPHLIQKMYKMNDCSVIMLNLGCGGTLQTIEIANALLEKGKRNTTKILIISSFIGCKKRYIETTILGDGVGMLLLGDSTKGSKIIDSISQTDGSYSFNQYKTNQLEMAGFNVFIKTGTLISKLLKNNNLTIDDIRLIIPLNTNFDTYSTLADFLDIPIEKFYLKNISNGGHLGDIDIIRNYLDILKNLSLNKNDKIILYALNYRNKHTDVSYYAVLLEV